MKRILNILTLLFVTTPIGIFCGIFFLLFRMIGRTKVLHWERFPHWERKLIVISNHPSMLETVMVPALFFHQYMVNPFWYAPVNTPDLFNFYRRWYWAWARPFCVPIDRSNGVTEGKSLYLIRKALDAKKIVVLFAEGGRTFKGKTFLYSQTGKKMRELKRGVGRLVVRTGARVLPIWLEGTDTVLLNHPTKLFGGVNLKGKITIKIGELMEFPTSQRIGKGEEIVKIIEQALLKLADEE